MARGKPQKPSTQANLWEASASCGSNIASPKGRVNARFWVVSVEVV